MYRYWCKGKDLLKPEKLLLSTEISRDTLKETSKWTIKGGKRLKRGKS